ncbi:MAG: hypothetical protein JST90_12305 [Bacteroidetes bacterium]|nr:hypothetical protein [Bacteroidota bacterium]
MKHQLKVLFTLCSILFAFTGCFFLFTALISFLRPDILLYDTKGYLISVFVAVVCFSFAYTLFGLSRRIQV